MPGNSLTASDPIDIPAADMEVIDNDVKSLQDVLVKHLIDLTTAERRKLPKMGPKTVDFVDKSLSYALGHPQFVPAFVDVEEFRKDVATADTLRTLQQALDMIAGALDDSVVLTRSRAYEKALSFYNSVKQAAKTKQYGAEAIAADLSARFPGRAPRTAPPAQKPAGDTPAAGAAA